MKIRMSEWEELVGADFAEHGIRRRNVGVSRAVSVLGLQHNGFDYSDIKPQGDNPCKLRTQGFRGGGTGTVLRQTNVDSCTYMFFDVV